MKLFSLVLTVFVLGATISPAEQIKASDPDGMMAFLTSEGIEATLGEDDYGDPNIRIQYYKTRFSIYFYDCKDGKNCQAIQYYVGYRVDGDWTQEQANVWNRERRFAKAYLTDNGSARLEYDIHTGEHGLHPDDFVETFSTWTRTVEEFEEELNW